MTNRFENGERKYESGGGWSNTTNGSENGSGERSVRCEYCGHDMRPFNPTAKAHICRDCLKEIQVGDRVGGSE